VPPQRIFRYRLGNRWRTEGHVEYEAIRRRKECVLLGDVHSHCDLPAFFSYTDDLDDKADGLRIILGRVNRNRPEIAASFVASGQRFPLRAEQACEDFCTPRVPPRHWLRQITCLYETEKPKYQSWSAGPTFTSYWPKSR